MDRLALILETNDIDPDDIDPLLFNMIVEKFNKI